MEQANVFPEVFISASHDEYKQFILSLVWNDLRTELVTQRDMIINVLGSADDVKDIYRLQGKLEACNDFLSMPEDFIRIIEERFSQVARPIEEDQVTDIEDNSSQYYGDLLDKYEEPI